MLVESNVDSSVENSDRDTQLCRMWLNYEESLVGVRAVLHRLIKRVDKIESREMAPLYDLGKHHHNMGWPEFVRMVDRVTPGRDWQISNIRGGVYRYCLRLLPAEGRNPIDIFGDELFDLVEQLYDKD